VVIRRVLEAGAATLPLCALLLVPVLLSMSGLYEWVGAHDDPHLQKISGYLNVPFFVIRSAVYFAVWIGLATWLRRLSIRQDTGIDVSSRLRSIAGPALVIFVLTTTFASTDWMMSLEPHWFSTIYGAMVLTGHVAGALAFAILLTLALSGEADLRALANPNRSHELGNLLLAFVMLWAYMSFSQYLLIWSANVSEETPWVLRRQTGGWQWAALLLVVVHFFAPFLVLLSRQVKRRLRALARVAVLIVAARWLDLLWLTAPAYRTGGFAIGWADVAATLGIGGLWLAAFLTHLGDQKLAPVGDPRLAEARL
jgi:hypothetical protein